MYGDMGRDGLLNWTVVRGLANVFVEQDTSHFSGDVRPI
jgi:hypothetical protein